MTFKEELRQIHTTKENKIELLKEKMINAVKEGKDSYLFPESSSGSAELDWLKEEGFNIVRFPLSGRGFYQIKLID